MLLVEVAREQSQRLSTWTFALERAKGIEPSFSAWEAGWAQWADQRVSSFALLRVHLVLTTTNRA